MQNLRQMISELKTFRQTVKPDMSVIADINSILAKGKLELIPNYLNELESYIKNNNIAGIYSIIDQLIRKLEIELSKEISKESPPVTPQPKIKSENKRESGWGR